MSKNIKTETLNDKIKQSKLNETNNQISEENNSLNIINKSTNDYIKLNNNSEKKKLNSMKRIEYIDIIETISIYFVVYYHNYAIIGTTTMANIILQFSSIISVPLFLMCNGTLLFSKKLNIKRHYKKSFMVFISIVLWKIIYAIFSIGLNFFKIPKIEIFYYLLSNNFLKGTNVPSYHFYLLTNSLPFTHFFPFLK